MDGSPVAVGAGATADRHGDRSARPVASGRAALRPGSARHGRYRRLVAAARRRSALCRQAAAVFLADRAVPGADALAPRLVLVAVVARGIRQRRAGVRPRPPFVESRDRPRGRAGAAVHGAIRVAGAPGTDRCDVVFLDDAQLVRLVASLAAGPVVALVHDRVGRGGARCDHEGRRISAATRF